MSDTFKRLDDFIQTNALINANDKLLLAVSGGMDSMLMTAYFINRSYQIGVAHCNFGLRGLESDADEALVGSYCSLNSVSFYSKSFNTDEYAKEHGVSIQMAARKLRYSWFDQVCRENNYTYIITAHHLTDQVETIVLNQLRGTGIKGLEGIKVRSGNIIRPLLCITKSEIEFTVNQMRIPFREDQSNDSDKYYRNRIRHHVLPQFTLINPAYEQTFFQNAQYIIQANAFIDFFMEGIKKELLTITNDGFFLAIEKLKMQPQPEFILHYLLQPYQFNSAQVANIYRTIGQTTGKTFFSDEYRLVTHSKHWVLEKIHQKPGETYLITPNTPFITTAHHQFLFEIAETVMINTDRNIANLDLEKIKFPLTIRTRKMGDKIKPLGMKGYKKISDILIDKKLSLSQKDKVEVIVSGVEIIWIAGLQINEDYKVTPQTRKVYKIRLEPKTNG